MILETISVGIISKLSNCLLLLPKNIGFNYLFEIVVMFLWLIAEDKKSYVILKCSKKNFNSIFKKDFFRLKREA